MTRFRPTVQVLDARTLPSAVTAAPVPPVAEAAQIAAPSSEHATGDVVEIAGKVSFQDIHFTGKVTFQDIHFTRTVSKASPKLML
jgi:hypothetical protein